MMQVIHTEQLHVQREGFPEITPAVCLAECSADGECGEGWLQYPALTIDYPHKIGAWPECHHRLVVLVPATSTTAGSPELKALQTEYNTFM
jgi:hypothetical protein